MWDTTPVKLICRNVGVIVFVIGSGHFDCEVDVHLMASDNIEILAVNSLSIEHKDDNIPVWLFVFHCILLWNSVTEFVKIELGYFIICGI